MQKVDISQYTGVIFTSRGAIDHYFRLAEELGFKCLIVCDILPVGDGCKLFTKTYCIQKKKNKFWRKNSSGDMLPLFKKHPDEKYLLPCSDVMGEDIPNTLNKAGIDWTKAVMYKTVSSDVSDLKLKDYDMLVFFSPQG